MGSVLAHVVSLFGDGNSSKNLRINGSFPMTLSFPFNAAVVAVVFLKYS